MTGPTLLVLGDHLESDTLLDDLRDDLLTQHPGAVVVVPDGGHGSILMRTCAAITAMNPEPPLILAAVGSAALLLPGVALSQRSMHRRIEEYLLLGPEIPPVSDSWPDAPVTIVSADATDASVQGRLRGWTVLRPEDLEQWLPRD